MYVGMQHWKGATLPSTRQTIQCRTPACCEFSPSALLSSAPSSTTLHELISGAGGSACQLQFHNWHGHAQGHSTVTRHLAVHGVIVRASALSSVLLSAARQLTGCAFQFFDRNGMVYAPLDVNRHRDSGTPRDSHLQQRISGVHHGQHIAVVDLKSQRPRCDGDTAAQLLVLTPDKECPKQESMYFHAS